MKAAFAGSEGRKLVGNEGFREEVIKKLNALQIDGNRFCALLKKHCCIVSGSFVLQCMLGIEWDSDIDVFQAIRERKFYDQDLGYEFANESFESQEEAKQSWWRKHFSSKLMASEKWRQGNALLNLVTVQPRNRVPRAAIMRFLARIISNFDLDFLKNMFDGERLSIMALDPVLSRACTADVTKCEKVTKEVFEEYQSPGEYPEFRPLPQTVYTRAVKYRDRGFTITLLRPNGKIWVFKPLARAAKNVSA